MGMVEGEGEKEDSGKAGDVREDLSCNTNGNGVVTIDMTRPLILATSQTSCNPANPFRARQPSVLLTVYPHRNRLQNYRATP